jgi:hypothetical protein
MSGIAGNNKKVVADLNKLATVNMKSLFCLPFGFGHLLSGGLFFARFLMLLST